MAGEKEKRNKYPDGVIPKFYKRQTLDVMIFTFIDTYRFLFPSVEVKEAANAFMHRHKIMADELSEPAILQSYYRSLHLLTAAQKGART